MASKSPSLRNLLLSRILGGILFLFAASSAFAQLVLDPASPASIDVWSKLTWLPESAAPLTIEQALAKRKEFITPAAPHSNFGVQQQGFWLRLPLRLEDRDRDAWILSVEYASLDRIDLYVTADGILHDHIVLGREVPSSARALPSASHAAPLNLEPDRDYDILIRVDTKSSAIVPIKLYRPTAFHIEEARTQVLQGLLAGLGLCLLIYSLAQWISVGDRVYFNYAMTICGTTLFFLAYFGLAAQHLWPEHPWLTVHGAVIAVNLALLGGALFVDTILDVSTVQPRVSTALRCVALTALVTGVMLYLGVVQYRTAQSIATMLGPLPMLLAIPAAYVRARRGERIGIYILLGWGAYAIATITMAGLLRGMLPSNVWTQHAFQIGATFEMVVWMRILGLRTEELRYAAQLAHLERDALHSLAHTDPLTGLPNRRGLTEVLQATLPGATHSGLVAVYLLDLDDFKPINDAMGHEAGDNVLVQVAQRLVTLLRSTDVVARLGGDEFVVVATQLPNDLAAVNLAKKLLEGFAKPFLTGGQLCRVGLTVGYALAPIDGHDANELLKRADAAMYSGKQAGRGNVTRGGATAYLRG